MANLVAFHGSEAIKSKYVKRIKRHQKQDSLVQGYGYYQDGKGCAVGCTLHQNDGLLHLEYELQLGIPQILARLEDRLFEGMGIERAKQWPEQFLSAIKPGTDLSGVWSKFVIWLLIDEKDGVLQYAKTKAAQEAINHVAHLYKIGEKNQDIWLKARRTDAADAAAAAAARRTAYSQSFEKQADKLLELLAAA